MGSSSHGTDDTAEWEPDQNCACPSSGYRVTRVRLKSVPLPGELLATAARVAALGLLQLSFKGQQYSHDCVQLWVSCEKCAQVFYVTLEYFSNGKLNRLGRYERIKGAKAREEKAGGMTLGQALQKYDQTQGRPQQYHPARFNCKHWARALFQKL